MAPLVGPRPMGMRRLQLRLFGLLIGALLQHVNPIPTSGTTPLGRGSTLPDADVTAASASARPISASPGSTDGHIRAEVNPSGSFVKRDADHKKLPRKKRDRVRKDKPSSQLELSAASEAIASSAGADATEQNSGEEVETPSARGNKKLDPQVENQDCTWNIWLVWSACTKTCGVGSKQRYRGRSGPLGNGAPCLGLNRETRNCNFNPCPVHCEFSLWDDWRSCTKTCGGPGHAGNQMRYRYVKVEASSGGKECDGALEEKEMCNNRPQDICPSSCKWGAWSEYTRCSLTCGTYGGLQVRQRVVQNQAINGGELCAGDPYQTRACNKKGCPVQCIWLQWQAWQQCSTSCGPGKRLRVRDMKVAAKFDGKCEGTGIMDNSCNVAPCPEDCTWRNWGEWDDCSQTCGGGERTKTRDKNEALAGGKQCVGEASWTEVCNMFPCPEK